VTCPQARAVAAACVLAASAVRAVAADVSVPGTDKKVDVSGYVDGLAVAELGGPHQGPQAITEIKLQSKIEQWLRVHTEFLSRAGGPFEGGHPGIMNFVHEFQNRTPSLEFNEAYAEVRASPDLELRAGIQKFAWGKLDGVPPTDVLTPRDLHDPLVRDYAESKIGIPAIQALYALPSVPSLDLTELRATAIYIPIAVPARLALADERWFPPTVRVGIPPIPEHQAETLINGLIQEMNPGAPFLNLKGPVRVPLEFNTLNHRPPKQFDAGGGAFRLAGTFREMDWSISHYTGPETGPDASLITTAFCPHCLPTAYATGKLPIRASTLLRQKHDIIHMTGADWATAIGGATVRAEVAVFQNRPYLRITEDLINEVLQPQKFAIYGPKLATKGKASVPIGTLFPDRDSVEWGVGADYLIGGFLPLLQLNQVVFTDHGPEQLLSDPETRLLASVKKRFLADTLEVELRGVYAFERGAWFVYPRISYRWRDNWRFRFGYLGIGGPLQSYIGQFRANDEFTFEARYSF
jgi:hypothetical protein